MTKYPMGTRVTFNDVLGRDGEPLTEAEIVRFGIVNGTAVTYEGHTHVPVWSPPLDEYPGSGDHMIVVCESSILTTEPPLVA